MAENYNQMNAYGPPNPQREFANERTLDTLRKSHTIAAQRAANPSLKNKAQSGVLSDTGDSKPGWAGILPLHTQSSVEAPTTGQVLPSSVGDSLFGKRESLVGTGRPIITPYGDISSRQATPGQPLSPAVVSDTGVQRAAPWDMGTARRATLATYPNIGIAGTPENTAFVAHAKRYGEQNAHENVDSLLGTLHPNGVGAAGASPALAHNDMPSSRINDVAINPADTVAPNQAAQYAGNPGNTTRAPDALIQPFSPPSPNVQPANPNATVHALPPWGPGNQAGSFAANPGTGAATVGDFAPKINAYTQSPQKPKPADATQPATQG